MKEKYLYYFIFNNDIFKFEDMQPCWDLALDKYKAQYPSHEVIVSDDGIYDVTLKKYGIYFRVEIIVGFIDNNPEMNKDITLCVCDTIYDPEVL